MTDPVRGDTSSADAISGSDELRARRDRFLAESCAESDADAVDASEIAELLAEARRRR